jgi:hypothetical protein
MLMEQTHPDIASKEGKDVRSSQHIIIVKLFSLHNQLFK